MNSVREVLVGSRILPAGAAAAAAIWTLAVLNVSAWQTAAAEAGVTVTYRQAGAAAPADVLVAPMAALYAVDGQPPTPFLAPGPFTAEFDGFVSVDLRDDYQFRAETNGSVEIRVANVVVLNATGDGGETAAGKPARLNRGPNAIRITYTSAQQGDSYLRLFWSSPEIPWEPVPAAALTRAKTTPASRDAQLAREGRSLVMEYRCLKCHQAAGATVPEAQMDAPAFTNIGGRLNGAWMARWVENPTALRASARMPRLVHGPEGQAEARDIAAFLSSLRSSSAAPAPPQATDDQSAAGEQLFNTLHCTACHVTSGEAPAGKVSLADVRDKFAPGALVSFLENPSQHFVWIRMPNFGLANAEAAALAAWLNTQAEAPAAPGQISGDVARGKTLVQTRGCLSCHSLDGPNEYKAPALADLPAAAWAASWHGDAGAVRFTFTADQRAAFRAFGATDRRSLERHAPADFAASTIDALGCRTCHGQIERVPSLEVMGEKLRPEWTEALINGSLGYKPRPWMEARMPAFAAYAAPLAAGLAAQHGYAPTAPLETTAVDEEMAEAGRLMVASGGCANCHNVAGFTGAQVPTTAGINLALTADRLRYPYYTRWLHNPARVWPETVMPKYFEKERGPFDFYEHDAARQMRALWEYMRQRDAMAPPQ